jgi:hypothetical protein
MNVLRRKNDAVKTTACDTKFSYPKRLKETCLLENNETKKVPAVNSSDLSYNLCFAQTKPGYVDSYTPSPENLAQPEKFQDMKFGLFIHWGIYGVMDSEPES